MSAARLSRRRALSRMLAAVGGAGALASRAKEALPMPLPSGGRPPNFVFILADDLGWADLGCYGNTFIETPHLDRLASQGMRFTAAYAAAPVCSPTRASIMTGQYPVRTGVYDFIPGHRRPWARLVPPPNAPALPPERVTLAEALAPAGYVSASIGKWHLGLTPEQQGFAAPAAHRQGAGALSKDLARQVAIFARDNPGKGVGPLTEQAVRFIEAHRDRPFLCFLSHNAVHIPCQARPDLVAKYTAKAARQATPINPVYAAMTQALDESVGLVLRALDDLALAENTVVFFFSDNGGLIQMYRGVGPRITTNAPLRAEKGTLYEGGIRVPLIVRWPGTAEPGSTCNAPVISNDFLPTMVEIAGGRPPAGQALDGRSLVPLLKRNGRLDRDALYWHYPAYHHSTPAAAVRAGIWKLIECFEDGRLELYNIHHDIAEVVNVAGQMPEKAAELRGALHAWIQSVGAPMPTPNTHYDPQKAHLWG